LMLHAATSTLLILNKIKSICYLFFINSQWVHYYTISLIVELVKLTLKGLTDGLILFIIKGSSWTRKYFDPKFLNIKLLNTSIVLFFSLFSHVIRSSKLNCPVWECRSDPFSFNCSKDNLNLQNNKKKKNFFFINIILLWCWGWWINFRLQNIIVFRKI
jgi:hypothetical protein